MPHLLTGTPAYQGARWASTGPLAFVLAIVVFRALDLQGVFEPPWLMPSLNLLFYVLGSLVAAVLAGRAYVAGAPTSVLALGCGMLVFGSACVSGASLIGLGHVNAGVTAHNIAGALAGTIHLLGAASMVRASPAPSTSRSTRLVAAYTLCLLVTVAVAAAAWLNLLPVFISPQGGTPLRSAVLMVGVAAYLLAALMYAMLERQAGVPFLRWYWLGLALIAIGLAAVGMGPVGSPLSWTGRVAQCFGQIYVVVGLLMLARQGGGAGLAVAFRSLEQTLQQTREQLQATLNSITDGYYALDSEWRFVAINMAAERHFGKPASELIGRNIWRVTGTTPDSDLYRCFHEALATGQPLHFDAPSRIRPGFWAELHLYPRNGLLEVYFADISARKFAEERMARQNAVLAGIARIFHEALTCQTEEELGCACLSVAEEVTQSQIGFLGELNHQTGKMVDVAMSRPAWEACRMLDPSGHGKTPIAFAVHGIYGRVLQDEKGFFTNDPPSHPDSIGTPAGHAPLTAFLGVPLIHAGKTIGMMALANRAGGYTPEQLKAAEALAPAIVQALLSKRSGDKLRRYELLAGNSRDIILLVNWEDGRLLEANAAAVQAYGYSREELLGLTVYDLRADPTQGLTTRQMAVADARGILFETMHRRKDGSTFPVEVSSRGAMIAGSHTLVSVVRDITRRKRAEEHLHEAKAAAEEASRAKDQFLAALSHELRTPLTPVLMLSQLLQDEPNLPPDVREDLKTISQNIQLEARLIDDLLDLTRITRGKVQLKPEIVDVHALIEHALLTCCDEHFARKDLNLVRDLQAVSPTVWADPIRLEQVLWNLIRNAIKFTPDGGQITIRTMNLEGGRVRIQVADTGMGIDPSRLTAIFNPFEQEGIETTRTFGGLGLGLAISKAIVDLHGGNIEAASEGRGRGAAFSLTLAIAAGAQDASLAGMGAPAGPETGRDGACCILIVEDHVPTAKVLQRLIRLWGWRVHWAPSVRNAEELAAQHHFDLVVSDIGLPDGSGHELMRHLRDTYGLSGIAVSGYGMEEDIQKSLASGFIRHLTKPVNFDELKSAVAEFLAATAPWSSH